MMIKRVVVISDLSEERDGPTAIAMAGVRHMRSLGIDVTYFCGDAGANPELERLGVRIIACDGKEIGTMPKSHAFLHGLFNRTALHKLRDLIKQEDNNETIYHLHNWSKILTPTVFLPLRSVSNRLLISTHDYFISCPNGGYFDFKKRQLCDRVPLSSSCLKCNCVRGSYAEKVWRSARDIERIISMGSCKESQVIAVHNAMVPLLAKGGVAEENIIVQKNPVLPWTQSRVIVEKNSTILYVGRMEFDKGPHLLAAAAQSLGLNITFVGDGPLRSHLEKEFSKFKFLGWKTRSQIAEIATEARMLVMPTGSRETFGLVAFEALKSGIPVIVSEFSSTANEIAERKIGLVCNPYDQHVMASLLTCLAKNDELCEQMSHRAWALRDEIAPSLAKWGEELVNIYVKRLHFGA